MQDTVDMRRNRLPVGDVEQCDNDDVVREQQRLRFWVALTGSNQSQSNTHASHFLAYNLK